MDISRKYQEFFNACNGQYKEAEDPTNKYMCFDLAFLWVDALGIPRSAIRHQFAREIWEKPTAETYKYFDLIPNSLNNVPQEGDIVVYKPSVGPAGHVDIATKKSNYLNLVAFAQNWGSPTYSREVTHYLYNGVYGWLRPRNQYMTDDVWLNQVKAILDSSSSPRDKRIKVEALPKL